MSGHSKWATTKHRKGAADAKRGKLFTKIIREMTVAARSGGGDVTGNPRLRMAVTKAKEANMPADNIKKAIQRGTGELPGVQYEEMTYEGYGPGGAAVLLDALTDNKNRAAAEIRHLFGKGGGNMGETGSVAWMFETKGQIVIGKETIDEDKLMSMALDAGAEDIQSLDETQFSVVTAPSDFEAVKKALTDAGIPIVSAEVTRLPKTSVRLEGREAEQMLNLMESLEDNDDIQKVYANFEVPDDLIVETE
jgi:YebC/PmpR family DNA-binding regulatory protein